MGHTVSCSVTLNWRKGGPLGSSFHCLCSVTGGGTEGTHVQTARQATPTTPSSLLSLEKPVTLSSSCFLSEVVWSQHLAALDTKEVTPGRAQHGGFTWPLPGHALTTGDHCFS